MIIGVNGRFLTKPYTGIGQYTHYLFLEMAEQNPEDRFIVVVPEKMSIDFPPNVEIVVVRERFLGTSGMKKTHWEQVKLPRTFKKYNVDVVHYPYPSNPWKGFHKPVVVTVHDTIPWTMAAYRRSFLTRLYQDRARKAVKKADAIVTVSETSRKDIVKTCGVQEDKVQVIFNAPPPHFLTRVDMDERERVLKKYGVDGGRPFFLYVGGYDERKNVETLARVFVEKVGKAHDVNLILVGDKSLNDGLYKSFDEAGKHKKDIHFTGFVDEADMPVLYQAAFGFVNVSMAEGFNLTLVEAAVSGTPMITSNIPVHHEVIGEYALYTDPKDEQGLADFMIRLLEDEEFYATWKAKLDAYNCPYSLQESAKALKELYRRL